MPQLRVAGYYCHRLMTQTTFARLYLTDSPQNHPARMLKVVPKSQGESALEWLLNEYRLGRHLVSSHIIRPLEWLEDDGAAAILCPLVAATMLPCAVQEQRWSLDERLDLARQMARAVSDLHQAGLLHRTLSPGHFLLDNQRRQLQLVDFEQARPFQDREKAESAAVSLQGLQNLRYAAPEQIGSTRRDLDYRTDLYSLGACFYYLFTGQPPFEADEPLELAHAHAALTPAPPSAWATRVPPALDEITLKLLAKDPEERYQSVETLLQDLQHFQQGARSKGFTPAKADTRVHFQIPNRLFGRDKALTGLMAGLSQAVAGQPAATLVSGISGIGKSALVQELDSPAARHRAYFARGKFDLVHQERPYSALVEALQSLFRAAVSEPESRLIYWQERLAEAVGGNAGLLAGLLPELTWILGPQPPAPQLLPDEHSRVFKRLMLRLVWSFCSDDRPLILHLEDMQWADQATLELLGQMAQDLRQRHLYLVLSCREEALREGHPLLALVHQLQASHFRWREVHLGPLDLEDITALLSLWLAQPEVSVAALARTLLQRTGGIPFFVRQFVEELHRQRLIHFDSATDSWHYHVQDLSRLPATGKQVQWLAEQLGTLPADTRHCLSLAACFGSSFNLHWLALATDLSIEAVLSALQPPVNIGLITLTRESPAGQSDLMTTSLQGRFCHDRFQQAAYELLSEDERLAAHRRIGETFFQHATDEERNRLLFDLVNHLNLGYSDCPTPPDIDLIELNRQAGERARVAAANALAFDYFQRAIDRLPAAAWQSHYPLSLGLHINAIETAYLSGRYQTMETLCDELLANARSLLDAKTAYHVRIQAYNVNNRLAEALQTALTLLRKLGVHLPSRPRALHILLAIFKTKRALLGRSIEQLQHLPPMRDARQLAIMETLHRVASTAYFLDPMLHPLIVLLMVRTTVRHGQAPAYTVSYAPYGIVLCGVLNQFRQGFEFGELSLYQANQPGARPMKCRTYVLVHAFIYHWRRYAGESIEAYRTAFEEGLETGDHEYGIYGCILECFNRWYIGQPLPEVRQALERCRPIVAHYSHSTAWTFHRVQSQVLHNLIENVPEPWRLEGDHAQAEAVAEECSNDRTALATLRLAQLSMAYRFRRLSQAMALLPEVDRLADGIRAMLLSVDYEFFAALVRIAIAPQHSGPGLRRRIKRHRKRLQRWAREAPMNFAHRHHLVEAEWYSLTQDWPRALTHYDAAINRARKNGFIQDLALAEERVSRFCQARNWRRMAGVYLSDSLLHYRQWGAEGLARWLESESTIMAHGQQQNHQAVTAEPSGMDISAFRLVLRAIASAIDHQSMLAAVVRGAVTFAGAQHGQLLLPDGQGHFRMEARWSNHGNETPAACQAIVQYVRHSGESLVVEDAQKPLSTLPQLHRDADIQQRQVRSILCMPINAPGSSPESPSALMGLLYLENNAVSGAFTRDRIETLDILCLAAAGRMELSRKAVTDGLTGLYNHEYCQTMLNQSVLLARRQQRPLSLILLDIDHFKQFNDRWGHPLGDRVLALTARSISQACRQSDIAARYGGEEFALILPDTPLKEAVAVAERIRAEIQSSVLEHGGNRLAVTVSAGVATLEARDTDATALLTRADHCLYQAKDAGRNRVTAES